MTNGSHWCLPTYLDACTCTDDLSFTQPVCSYGVFIIMMFPVNSDLPTIGTKIYIPRYLQKLFCNTMNGSPSIIYVEYIPYDSTYNGPIIGY